MSDVIEVTGVMEAAAILQLDYIMGFCAEHLLKKDDETACVQTKIEGVATDESGHSSADVDDASNSASDAQSELDIPQEARYKLSKHKRIGRKVAPNTRYAKRLKAIKQAVETPDVKGEYITSTEMRVMFLRLLPLCNYLRLQKVITKA